MAAHVSAAAGDASAEVTVHAGSSRPTGNPLLTGPPTVGQMVVAGDGNAYLPYAYSHNAQCANTESYLLSSYDTYLMALRMSPDGTTSKIQLGHWTANCVFTAGGYTPTGTQMAFTGLDVITNADAGAAVFATLSSHDACNGNPQIQNQISFVSQDGLGAQVNTASNNFAPGLQREDGSYNGTDSSGNVVALGQDGSVLWQQSLPGTSPLYATADGGVEASTGGVGQPGTLYTLDAIGTVTSQSSYTGAVPSWKGESYSATVSGGISDLSQTPAEWATSYQAMTGGNLSSNETSIGIGEPVEGISVFGLKRWSPSCSLGTNNVLLSGTALQQYNNLKQSLLSGGYLTCPSCTAFFAADPTREGYFSQLTTAVTNQVPYDGVQTNISQYEAGMSNGKNPTDVSVKKSVPVCGLFVPFNAGHGTQHVNEHATTAASQIAPTATNPAVLNTYINTDSKALMNLTQGTILHEALHNLTGLYDFVPLDLRAIYGYNPPYDLKTLLGKEPIPGDDPTPGSTVDITNQLEGQGCASNK